MEIVTVEGGVRLEQVRRLFAEYWESFGFTPCFQNFEAELAALPGKYVPPGGRLALALEGDDPAGCAALRKVDDERCEAKRLYVRPQYRGTGLGRRLLDWVIAEARREGYRELLGDTMPVMGQALAMYDLMGFERTGPYGDDPTPGAIFLKLRL